jgi:hypothetical protein
MASLKERMGKRREQNKHFQANRRQKQDKLHLLECQKKKSSEIRE